MITKARKLESIIRWLLIATLIIPPFTVANSLLFPFVSGKAYLFRLFVEISLFFWLALIIQHKGYRPNFKNPLVLATLLFLIGLIITGVFGVDPIRSFFSGLDRADGIIQFAHWIAYFLMLITVFRTKESWDLFLKIFIGLVVLLSVYAWLGPEALVIQESRLTGGSFGSPSYLAGLLLFAIGITAALWTKAKTSRGWLWSTIVGLFLITLVFTQTRGAYLGFLGGLVSLTVFLGLFLRKEHKGLVVFLGAILVIALLSISTIFVFRETELVQNQPILNRIADVSRIREALSGRERIITWQIAIESFKEKPLLGWGPENFGVAFNKHYDYHVGLTSSWFDRPHNQWLQVLTEGGIFLFGLYLFWISSIFYLILKVFRKRRLSGSIMASTYLAFLIQGWFLFDTYPLYLGLFPFLGWLYFEHQSVYPKEQGVQASEKSQGGKKSDNKPLIYGIQVSIGLAILSAIIFFAWLPFRSNSLFLKYTLSLRSGIYEEAYDFLQKANAGYSPYTFFDIRLKAGWELIDAVEKTGEGIRLSPAIPDIYKLTTSGLEEALTRHPNDQQIYYVLGKLYRLGALNLGFGEDLAKAESILKRGLEISPERVDYFNEFLEVLIAEGRAGEAQALMREYAKKIEDPPYSFLFLGHAYLLEGDYNLAVKEYDLARERGYEFWSNETDRRRYLAASEAIGNYENILELSQEYISQNGPNAAIFLDIAIAYKELGEEEKARNAFIEAVKLDERYKEYSDFFGA